MARTAADAVKSPDLKLVKLSGPKPVRSPDNKRRLEEKSTPHRPKPFPSNLPNQKLKQRVSFNSDHSVPKVARSYVKIYESVANYFLKTRALKK